MTFREKEPQGSPPSEDFKKAFFARLEQADISTIRVLAAKVAPDVRRIAREAGLNGQDSEEMLNDAILATLLAIRKGTFQFMGFHPAAYTLGVAKKLAANRARSKKPQTELLENVAAPSDFDPEIYLKNKERAYIVKELLSRLGEDCREVLLLKYFEHKKDREVVSEKLTPYATVASLKSKREQCLKKLAKTAREAGIKAAF
ncbi:MAG: sigma-70 family RNA polymerase sigma factor [Phaeodactylibacter sp.]|nr:sigma-70 family RNA polymerase sigma factor [Phaeodactylibacter sp.]MCB9273483.1 sigma-70 family RNA polymerase sigma factor [Lewinellaceae bacterium]